MAGMYYNGTSAYKIEEYNAYTSNMNKKQEEKIERESAQKTINRKRLVAIVSAVFVIAAAFLYLNVLLLQASATYNQATVELEDVKMRNAQLTFDIASGVDLAVVEAKAKSQFGMQTPESHQNVYIKVVQNDYTETFTSKGESKGVVEQMITSLKAFFTYIG